TGLSPATEYDFRLSVTGGSHAGTSNVVSVKTTTVPVTDFANTGKTSDTASFSWSLVNGATGIIIQQSPKGTDTWVTSTTAPIATNATSAIVTGLSPATEYDFRLVVTGGSNAGTSNVVSVETNSVPVTDFASTGKTSDTASFSWSLVNGATGMTIQQSPKGADTWVTSTTAPIATNATSAIVTGISPATEYDFRLVVTGGSHAGTSNVESVTTNTLPVADFASTGKTSDTASFSWSSVNGATEMSIQQSPKGADTWVTSTTAPIATNATSAIVTGLSPATEYDFRLVVTGGSHAGTSNVESVTTSAAPPIIIPIGDFNSTGKTSTTANFSWSPAISATTIRIEQSPKGINNWTLASTGTILPTADNTTVIGLRPDTEYDFRLVVLGGMNEGTSNIISLMTDTEPSSDLTYTIAPIENQTLNPLQEGYTSPEVKSITVIRTGSGVLNQLSVELIGANAKNFVITQSANNTLDEHNPMTDFTIKANDGLQPGTYVVTVKVTAANMTDVTFTTTQIINPIETPVIPSAPENLTAFGGNHFVELFWNAVTGADFYKIYMKDASGSYNNEPIATVNSAVYRVQELINGTEYFFKVIAGNSYGESIFSSEASATPKAVPSAPTRVSAQAGDGSATVVFDASQDDGGSPITGYIVMDSTGSIHVTGKESPIIITGLTNGTSYTFTVSAINEAGNSLPSEVSNAVVPNTPTSTPSPLPIPTPAPTPVAPIPQQPVVNTGVDVLVNGKVEKAGTASSEIVNNQKVWTIKVNQKKIEEKLQSEGLGSIVTIPFQLETDVLVAELNGEMVKNMESNQAVLEIKTAWATYTIPAKQINIDSVSEKVGQTIALRDIKVKVEIAKPLPEMLKIINNATIKGNFTIVAPPVNFIVTGTYGGTNIQVDKFNAYVKRTISIPDNIDPHKITTGIVVESDGRIRHVPTKVTNIEGKYYAVINSLTNSTYTVVWHPLEFTDVANHWSKDAVNDMGSRMVIEGTGEGQFSPNRNITRAEFATIIVRGLGLKLESGSVPFSDVKEYDWFSNAIKTAYSYNLIKGYADGTFGPHDQITREEAMVIIAKAMKITNLKAMLPNQYTDTNLHPYSDISTGSEWARDSIAESVLSGIFTGRSNTELAPKAYITRAEVAMIIQRLLKKSDLI
uniref:fibronectin type III domain-containing protein n=1 Tax=Paenibacillus pini TaxID=669461 RepID=UPI000690B046